MSECPSLSGPRLPRWFAVMPQGNAVRAIANKCRRLTRRALSAVKFAGQSTSRAVR